MWPRESTVVAADDQELAFYGAHQPGISAPVQAQSWLTAFDLKPGTTIAQVRTLMRDWTSIAATTMAGKPLPSDDAMAYGRGPGALTVTVGVGASLLTKLGLGHQIPAALDPLPTFLGDAIDAAASDGDLVLLVAANDGLVAVHALRAMQRSAAAVTTQRWQINGFGEAGGVMPSPTATPRNLMGQLDGTGNPKPGTAAFDQAVYVPANGDPAWMRGGSYLVYRRIRMLLNEWDTLDRGQQEAVIGRDKVTGAPLSGGTEFSAPDYERFGSSGSAADPAGFAHSAGQRRSSTPARRSTGVRSATTAACARDGSPDAGLMFLAFQQNPATRIHDHPAAALRRRHAQHLHPPRGERTLRGAARMRGGRLSRPGAAGGGRVKRQCGCAATVPTRSRPIAFAAYSPASARA